MAPMPYPGAVNVITRRDFEGVELAATYGQALDQSDGTRQSYEITLGSNLADNRGNVAVSLGYTKVDPVRQDARTLGMFSLSSTNGAVQGSGTATPVTFNNLVPGQLDTTTGAIVPIYNTYNFQPQNYYQTALDRYQGTAIGHYNVTDRVEVYANLMYSRSDVDSQSAASGSFLNNFAVPIGNPFLPAAARQQICTAAAIAPANCVLGSPTEVTLSLGRRFEELGPRNTTFENNAFQYTTGVQGDISDNWTWDVYWSYGEGEQTRTRDDWGHCRASNRRCELRTPPPAPTPPTPVCRSISLDRSTRSRSRCWISSILMRSRARAWIRRWLKDLCRVTSATSASRGPTSRSASPAARSTVEWMPPTSRMAHRKFRAKCSAR